MKEVQLLQNILEQWYLVPNNKVNEFNSLRPNNDMVFHKKFDKYRIGWNQNAYQLHITDTDYINLTR